VVWGVHTVHSSDARDFQDMVTKASHFAVTDGFAQESDRIIITAGVPFGTPGATNVLRVTRVEID
jgi:pyruvate kinase